MNDLEEYVRKNFDLRHRANFGLVKFMEVLVSIYTNDDSKADIDDKDELIKERQYILKNYQSELDDIIEYSNNEEERLRNLKIFLNKHLNEIPVFLDYVKVFYEGFKGKLIRFSIYMNDNSLSIQWTNKEFWKNPILYLFGWFMRPEYALTQGYETSDGRGGYEITDKIEPNLIDVYIKDQDLSIYDYEAGYFSWINKSEFDLDEWQIYREVSEDKIPEQCLIYCIKKFCKDNNYNILNKDWEEMVKRKIINLGKIKTKHLSDIAEIIDMFIECRKVNQIGITSKGSPILDKNLKKNITKYPIGKTRKNINKNSPTIKLALINEHYINDDYINVSNELAKKYIIKRINGESSVIQILISLWNYNNDHDDVFERIPESYFMEGINKITSGDFKFIDKESKFIDVLEIEKDKCLKSGDKNVPKNYVEAQNKKSEREKYKLKIKWFKNHSKYESTKESTKEEINKYLRENIHIYKWYSDLESMFEIIDDKGILKEQHLPFMIGTTKTHKDKPYIIINNKSENRRDPEFIKEWLRHFPKHVNIIYFHNMKYDLSVLNQIGLGKHFNVCMKEGQYYSAEFSFEDRYFKFECTYKRIPFPLDEWKKIFGLKSGKKSDTLYPLYTSESTMKQYVDVEHYDSILSTPFNNIDNNYLVYEDVNNKLIQTNYFNIESEYYKINNKILIPKKTNKNEDIWDRIGKEYLSEDGTKFYHIKHYKDYLVEDCNSMAEGHQAYNINMEKALGKECYDENRLTIASIAEYAATCKGSYNNISWCTGGLQKSYLQASPGGQTCTANNEMINTFKEYPGDKTIRIEDHDNNSEYPYSIYRFKEEYGGMPAGKTHRITKEQISIINTKNSLGKIKYLRELGYGCYTIKINDLKIKKSISILCTLDDGIRNWTNDVIGLNDYIGFMRLKSAVEFQGLEFEITDGVYWNEYNPNFCDFVKTLYDKRVEMKKEIDRISKIDKKDLSKEDITKLDSFSVLEKMIKLVINSAYGKNGLKAPPTKTKYLEEDKFEEYLNSRKGQELLTTDLKCYPFFNNLNGQRVYTVEEVNTKPHWNRQQISMAILDMSKRVIHEFIDCIDTLGLIILYVDTDAVQYISKLKLYQGKVKYKEWKYGEIDNEGNYIDGVYLIRKIYQDRYNKDPFDKYELGRFSSDFEMKAGGYTYNDVHSVGAIYLGKKAYCHRIYGERDGTRKDMIEGDVYDDKLNKIVRYEEKATMKGIRPRALDTHCKDNFKDSLMRMYNKRYEGKRHFINMLGGGCVSFHTGLKGTIGVYNISNFNRTI